MLGKIYILEAELLFSPEDTNRPLGPAQEDALFRSIRKRLLALACFEQYSPYPDNSPLKPARRFLYDSLKQYAAPRLRRVMQEVDNMAVEYNLDLDFINDLRSPLYISLDLDALDPAFAPGVSHHEPGGLSSRDVIKIIQSLPVEIIGADIVEMNPNRDINDMTAMLLYKLFKEIMAKMIL